jgi:hypothetical protein
MSKILILKLKCVIFLYTSIVICYYNSDSLAIFLIYQSVNERFYILVVS